MIRTLTLENFKPFGGRHEIALAPLTMILGPNSGGKSSLLQALLLIGQSFGGDDVRLMQDGELDLRGPWTDLGSFDSMVHRHEASLPVTIGLTSDPPNRGPVRGRSRAGADGDPSLRELRELVERYFLAVPHGADICFTYRQSDRQITPTDFVLRLPAGGFPLEYSSNFARDPEEDGPQGGFLASVSWAAALLLTVLGGGPLSLTMRLEALLRDASPLRFDQSGILPGRMRLSGGSSSDLDLGHGERRAADELEVILMEAESIVRRCVISLFRAARSMEFIGPLRTPPDRVGVISGRTTLDMRSDGAGLLDVLARRPGLVRRANNALADLEIPYAMSVASVESGQLGGAIGDLHALLLKDSRRNVDVAVADVGFGISQVLPIVIQAVAARDKTVIVQQPELHLHPALQLKLAEFLALQTVGSRNQFILETHSEHMVLRTQRLVRRGQLAADDVAVLFVDGRDSIPEVKRIRLGQDGEFLDEWPAGFFEERLDELFEDETG